MAVIGKIRERGNLLVILVGGALLLFVLDALLSNRGGPSGGQAIGEIAGKEVNAQEFSTRVETEVQRYRNNGTPVNDQLQEQVRNQVWNQIISERVMMPQVEESGIGNTVSAGELDDIRFGNNISPMFRNDQSLKDPATGEVDKARLRQGLKNLQDRDRETFRSLMEQISTERVYNKYNALVKKSCFVNSAQVKQEWAAKNTKATFNFVAKRFDAEPDSLYAVGDEDLRRYFDAHRNERKWHQKASRRFVYVRFPAVPTEGDMEETRKELEQLKPEFAAATDLKADSAFVMAYADTKNAKAAAYTPGTADKLNDSLIVNADTGMVVGPFREGNQFKLVKVAELADVDEAKVRHILVKADPTNDAERKQRADSILTVLKKDRSKFQVLLDKYTEDNKAMTPDGVYGFFDKNVGYVQEFKDAGFNNPKGWMGVVKTSFGYHIMEVLDKRTRAERRVFTVDRKVQPVQAMKDAWKKANEFSLKNTDTTMFRKSAEEMGLAYTPVDEMRADSRYVPGLQNAGEVVRWANHSDELMKPSGPLASDESYVVGILTGIRKEGVPELEDVRETFTAEVRKEKKAEALAAKMNGKTDLNALATELGTNVQNAPDMALSSNSLPGGYADAPVIGQVFSLQNGQTSVPLKGDLGVYVVNMTTLTPAPAEMPQGAE
ncbi:MAG TPA: SurA N-terminal domain-containing protein, partial [Flavobacteriales bacterium]|nr:SurA N-terminal domain-containing protein [Flavobacteriales bacterium]